MIKVQYVDSVANAKGAKGTIVGKRLKAADKKGMFDHAVEMMDLNGVLERNIEHLSGGEV